MSLTELITRLLNARPQPAFKTVPKGTSSSPWHAVGIAPGVRSCSMARRESETRYLSKNAPPLPLKGCDSEACTCRYRHYDDRRAMLRRSADVWSNGGTWNGQERRHAGRRSSDAPQSS